MAVFAGFLVGLAALYGVGATGSLALRIGRAAVARKWEVVPRYVVYLIIIVGAGFALSSLPQADPAFPSPLYIPLYVIYIGLCHYLANVDPKRRST
jgi:cytochrome bd-type quinol oxidase subunit 2